MGAKVVQDNRKLPDGRPIKVLGGTFAQCKMFNLHEGGGLCAPRYGPKSEDIMTLEDLGLCFQSEVYPFNVNGCWRTRQYAFYPIGFESKFGGEETFLTDKITYVEDGISFVLEIPDVSVKINGKDIDLNQVSGIGVIPLEKLRIKKLDEKTLKVSVTSNFDPRTDVEVIDIIKPKYWSRNDAEGRQLVKLNHSNKSDPNARYSHFSYITIMLKNKSEKGSSGWQGCLGCGVDDIYSGRYVINASLPWSFKSRVALVGRGATAPQVDIPKEALAKVTGPNALVERAKQLEMMALDFDQKFCEMYTADTYRRFVTEPLETAKMLRQIAGEIVEAARRS